MLVMCDVSEVELLIINSGSQCIGQRNVWWQKGAAVFWEAFRFWQKLCKNKIMMCNLSFFGDSLNNTTQRRSRKERKLGEKINFVKVFGQFVQIIMILWAGSGWEYCQKNVSSLLRTICRHGICQKIYTAGFSGQKFTPILQQFGW